MRRISSAFVVVTFALALFIAGFAAASFRAAPAAAKETLTVIEHATTDTTIDLGEKGDTVGDTLAFSNDVYDADNANVVGHDEGSCTRTAAGKTWHCTWTLILDNGSIVVEGPFYDTEDSTLAIIGGTGDYAGASGQMQLKAREGGTEYEFTYELN
jgi:hypothetical protein